MPTRTTAIIRCCHSDWTKLQNGSECNQSYHDRMNACMRLSTQTHSADSLGSLRRQGHPSCTAQSSWQIPQRGDMWLLAKTRFMLLPLPSTLSMAAKEMLARGFYVRPSERTETELPIRLISEVKRSLVSASWCSCFQQKTGSHRAL